METKAALPLRRTWSLPSVWTVLLLALVALGAKLVVSVATEGWRHGVVPYDLATFLRAAHAVLDGVSPYPPVEALYGDANYVYPPLLALAITPLTTVSAGLAVAAWTIISTAAVLLALRLLGVRDWRCYGVVFLLPPTRSAIYGGTVGPLLLLAIGLAWHHRKRRPVVVALATASAVTLKLFLWPLVVWLAATRRLRATAIAVGAGLALALGSWAVIGFRGIGEYPDLLRRLAENEASSSYSLVALGEAVGLPGAIATVLAVAVGAALLLAVVAHRDDDRAALIYAIAAALALTPIAWLHYFILLLVPIALARPRLSPLWFAPLPLKWLVGGGWPEGDLGKLLVMLALCVLVVAMAARRSRLELPAC